MCMAKKIIPEKKCEICSSVFYKGNRLSTKQWNEKRFCSRKCGATKVIYEEDEIVKRYLRGESSTEIGRSIHTSGTHILRILKRNSVEIRCASENKMIALNRPATLERIRKSSTGRQLPESGKEKLRLIIGSKNANWRSGITISAGGYLQFTNSKANGEHAGKMIHTVIAEWKYKRKLDRGEHVHHIDRNKLNNDPSNIVVLSASEHSKTHTQDKLNGKRSKQM